MLELLTMAEKPHPTDKESTDSGLDDSKLAGEDHSMGATSGVGGRSREPSSTLGNDVSVGVEVSDDEVDHSTGNEVCLDTAAKHNSLHNKEKVSPKPSAQSNTGSLLYGMPLLEPVEDYPGQGTTTSYSSGGDTLCPDYESPNLLPTPQDQAAELSADSGSSSPVNGGEETLSSFEREKRFTPHKSEMVGGQGIAATRSKHIETFKEMLEGRYQTTISNLKEDVRNSEVEQLKLMQKLLVSQQQNRANVRTIEENKVASEAKDENYRHHVANLEKKIHTLEEALKDAKTDTERGVIEVAILTEQLESERNLRRLAESALENEARARGQQENVGSVRRRSKSA